MPHVLRLGAFPPPPLHSSRASCWGLAPRPPGKSWAGHVHAAGRWVKASSPSRSRSGGESTLTSPQAFRLCLGGASQF